MPVLGAATLELNADSAKLEQDLGRAVGQAAAFGTAIGQVMGQAISAGVDKLTHMVTKAIETGDELNKLSQKTGMTVENLSNLRVAAELSGASIGGLKTGIKQLYEHLSQAGQKDGKSKSAFEAIGLDVEKLRDLKPDELFRTVAVALSKYEDGANKSAVVTALLGRSGVELLPLINDLIRTEQIGKQLGLTMSKDVAEASERFKDNMTISRLASEAMGQKIAQVLLPTLEKFSNYLVENAKNTERLDQVTRAADAGLKMFATGATIVSTAFKLAGENIGAVAAMMSLTVRGKFSEAWSVMKSRADGGVADIRAAAEGVGKIWDDTASTVAAKSDKNAALLAMAAMKAAEKIKAARKEADSEFAAFQKIYAIEREVDQATNEYHRKQGEETTRITQIAIEQKQELFEMMEKIRYAASHGGETGVVFDEDTSGFTKVAKHVKEVDDIGKKLGLTFTSAFEDAVTGGKKFSDILKGIEQDIARIVIRKTVTEPIGNAISGAINTSGIGDWLKGMLPSFAVGTEYVPRDMLAMVHQGEAIVPAAENTRGESRGGVVVNMTVNTPDAGGFRASRNQIAADLMSALSTAARRGS